MSANDNQRATSRGAVANAPARVNADNPTEKGEQTGSWVRQVAQAMEEQMKEDQQELETCQKKRNVEDVQRIKRQKQETEPHAKRNGQTHAS